MSELKIKELKVDIKKYIKMLDKYKYLIIVLVVGIFLLIIPNRKTETKNKKDEILEFDCEEFEERIEKALSKCEGVGKCEVILALESTPESVYAKEARRSLKENDENGTYESDSDTKPSVMSEGSGVEGALIVKRNYPEFRGATIICEGALRNDVKTNIVASVSALTGLSTDKISVVKMIKK